MSKQHILVTGGAGFIGSHTAKALARAGCAPVTLDNLSTGNREAVKWGPLIEGSVHDTALVEQVIRSNRIEAVIHFAASAYVGESVTDPGKYYRNNVSGMISLLDACAETGVDKMIFSSSCATYGVPESLPIAENSAQRPINPYGRTKLICEDMLADYAAAHDLNYVILRYFNACGADPDGELAEWHDPETHLIPLALMAASGKCGPLKVFGTDYDTADGTCVRDYIHVCDLAAAHVRAWEHLESGGGNLALNLGTGRGLSIKDIIGAVDQTTGQPVPVQFDERRPGDPPALYADPSLAREKLGFESEMSDIDAIIRTAAPSFGLEVHHDLQS